MLEIAVLPFAISLAMLSISMEKFIPQSDWNILPYLALIIFPKEDFKKLAFPIIIYSSFFVSLNHFNNSNQHYQKKILQQLGIFCLSIVSMSIKSLLFYNLKMIS